MDGAKWTATVDESGGVTLAFDRPVTAVTLALADLQTLLTAANLEYLAAWDQDRPEHPSPAVVPSVEVG